MENGEVLLGEGSFGKVVAKGDKASKTFDVMEHLIMELVATRYVSLSEHPNIVQLKGRNLHTMSMDMKRWHSSLFHAMWSRKLTSHQTREIFKSLLLAVHHLESLSVIHSDIKPDNILVNEDCTFAALTDFGISSASGYARIGCTTKEYTSSDYINHRAHDAYAVALVGLELFYGYRAVVKNATKLMVRKWINQHVTNSVDKKCFLGLLNDDPKKCWYAKRVLQEMYKLRVETKVLEMPKFGKPKMDVEQRVAYHVGNLARKFGFRRISRCINLAAIVVSLTDGDLKIFSTAMSYIFACVFRYKPAFRDKPDFVLDDALTYCPRCSRKEMIKAIDTIIGSSDIISLMFHP